MNREEYLLHGKHARASLARDRHQREALLAELATIEHLGGATELKSDLAMSRARTQDGLRDLSALYKIGLASRMVFGRVVTSSACDRDQGQGYAISIRARYGDFLGFVDALIRSGSSWTMSGLRMRAASTETPEPLVDVETCVFFVTEL